MKKLLCVFLSLLFIFTGLSFSACAQGGVTAERLNPYLQMGEKLSLSVTFTTDTVCNAFQYELCYDTSALEFINASSGIYNEYESGKIKYVNVGNSKTDNVVFTFKTKKSGETDVVIANILSANNEEYTYSDVTFTLTVDPATRGDVDGNGKIDTTDLALLKLYLAGLNDGISDFADYDKDGEVSTSDLASLKLYLAG